MKANKIWKGIKKNSLSILGNMKDYQTEKC